jgi:hypothetical protein
MLFGVECLIDGSGVIAGLRAIVDGTTGELIRVPGDFGMTAVKYIPSNTDHGRRLIVEQHFRVTEPGHITTVVIACNDARRYNTQAVA